MRDTLQGSLGFPRGFFRLPRSRKTSPPIAIMKCSNSQNDMCLRLGVPGLTDLKIRHRAAPVTPRPSRRPSPPRSLRPQLKVPRQKNRLQRQNTRFQGLQGCRLLRCPLPLTMSLEVATLRSALLACLSFGTHLHLWACRLGLFGLLGRAGPAQERDKEPQGRPKSVPRGALGAAAGPRTALSARLSKLWSPPNPVWSL